jgi:ferrous iron transport protein A
MSTRELGERRTLADLRPGQRGIIGTVRGSGAVRQRLLDLGLLPAVGLAVERIAPAGDPLWIRVRGMQLSIRRDEARCIDLRGESGATAAREDDRGTARRETEEP